jgi:membrane protein
MLLDGTGRLASLGLVGAASLILTASLLVLALQDALNTIWERPVRLGIRHTLMRRLVAFVVVAGAGGVLILSFALNAVTGFLNQLVPDVAVVESLQEVVGLATSWALAIGVVALLFRYLPDVRVSWVPVLIGATVTALLLAVGTVLVGAYLRRYAASSLVGVTGSVFLVLLWIYYEAQIVLAGAEFTRVLARHRTGVRGRRCRRRQPAVRGRPAPAQAMMPPSTSAADAKPSCSMIPSVCPLRFPERQITRYGTSGSSAASCSAKSAS